MKDKLADSEEKIHHSEQAFAALVEKARSDNASYAELVSKLEDQVRSYDAAYADLVSQMQEKICANEAICVELVSQVEEKVRVSEAARSELAKKLEERGGALKDRESVRVATLMQEPIGLSSI